MTDHAWPEILAASEKNRWRVEDLIEPDQAFDFALPFLPDALVRAPATPPPQSRLKLNQSRGHTYLYQFGLVEGFILPFVLDHARPGLGSAIGGGEARRRKPPNRRGQPDASDPAGIPLSEPSGDPRSGHSPNSPRPTAKSSHWRASWVFHRRTSRPIWAARNWRRGACCIARLRGSVG